MEPLHDLVFDAIETYFFNNPEGQEVTLAVLFVIGRDRLERIAGDRTFDRAKQDAGLLSAHVLVEISGEDDVETLRRNDRIRVASRRNTWPNLKWVNSFAPHRVVRR